MDTAPIPLMLLPGLLCDRTVWQHQLDAFRGVAEPQVVEYPDCRTLGAMADRVLALAPPRFALAGHSMGGRVAFEVLRKARGRVLGLALLDTAAGPVKAGEEGPRRELVAAAQSKGMDALVENWLPPMVHPARLQDAQLMQPMADMIRRHTPKQFAGQIEALLARPDARAVLPTIDVPAMVLCGREDGWRTPEQHQELAAAIPGAAFVVVPDCGHMAPFERPDAVNAALHEWLVRVREMRDAGVARS